MSNKRGFTMKGHQALSDSSINCGGYALGIKDWVLPFEHREDYRRYEDFARLLEDYFHLETVGVMTHDELLDHWIGDRDNYLLYRHSQDVHGPHSDFHFMNLDKRGKGWHKRGATFPEKLGTDEIFNVWYNGRTVYDSKILVMRWTGPRGPKVRINYVPQI